MNLFLIGFGANSGDISLNAFEQIKQVKTVVLRTEKTYASSFLKSSNINYVSLDGEYERSRNFDTLTKNLVSKVSDYLKDGDVAYLTEGSVGEDSACSILKSKFPKAQVFEGVSKAKSAMSSCNVFSTSYTAISAFNLNDFNEFSYPLVIYDLDSAILASEWKLKLIDKIGEERKVWLYIDKQPKRVSIFELDRFENYDYSTAVVIEDIEISQKERFNFYDLYAIVSRLRAKGGCPWDIAQTKESIRKNLIEECYELADAIDLDDDDKIREEIGDVILQAVFHMIFGQERGAFTPSDVLSDECVKLIFRHTHIFGKDKAENLDKALDIWDKNKQREKGFENAVEYVNDVPKCFPALLRAEKVIKRITKSCNNDMSERQIIEEISNCLKGETNLSKALILICYIMKKKDIDAEEELYFEIQKLIDAFSNDGDNSFDISSYFKS